MIRWTNTSLRVINFTFLAYYSRVERSNELVRTLIHHKQRQYRYSA